MDASSREEQPGRACPSCRIDENLIFVIIINLILNSSIHAICRTPPEEEEGGRGGQEGGTEPAGAISGLPAVPGSVGGRDLAALGCSLPRPSPGRGRAGPWGSGEDPPEGTSAAPPALFHPWLSPGSLSFCDREQPQPSRQPPRLHGRVWGGGTTTPGLRRRGARPEAAGMGSGGAPGSCARRQLEIGSSGGVRWAPGAMLTSARGGPRERSGRGAARRTPPAPLRTRGPTKLCWSGDGGDAATRGCDSPAAPAPPRPVTSPRSRHA